ncbi:hypothetical protein [uncultured Neptuniibacter sp.]|uniref:hypothetical protein n=1 Tax=uncultured Neptuniibacter sp. TaxID=502143 RepID=UPI0026113969|nr:hypothetical protein [uncultured Neptuniibacter sp.]
MYTKKLLLVAAGSFISFLSFADDTQALIDRARSAAPSMVSAEATVIYRGKTLVEGRNGWVCMPETLPDDNAPICNDAQWMKMLTAVSNQADFRAEGIGVSYMLQGDGGVSNSDPYHPNPMKAHDFIKEGPHLMLIVPKEILKGMTDDPAAGGPYVMWKDTPYAHIMIPVGERE